MSLSIWVGPFTRFQFYICFTFYICAVLTENKQN